MIRPKIVLMGVVDIAAQWIGWAEKELNRRSKNGTEIVNKYLTPTPGVDVYLRSFDFLHQIRIEAYNHTLVWMAQSTSVSNYEFNSHGVSASASGFRALPFVVSSGGYFYYVESVSYSAAQGVTPIIKWQETSLGRPNYDGSSDIADSILLPTVKRFIKKKEAQYAHFTLNDAEKWAPYKLAISQVNKKYFYKEFARPAEDDVLYSDYMSLIKILDDSGYVSVPADKMILIDQEANPDRTKNYMIARELIAPDVTYDNAIGPTSAQTVFMGAVALTFDLPNFVSGTVGMRVDKTERFNIPNEYGEQVVQYFSVRYDTDLMDLKIEDLLTFGNVFGPATVVSRGSPSTPPDGVLFSITSSIDISLWTYDGILSVGSQDVVFVGEDRATGTPDFTLTLSWFLTPSIPADAGNSSRVGVWDTGAKSLDVYADGSVKDAGNLLFNLAPEFQGADYSRARWSWAGIALPHSDPRPYYSTFYAWQQENGHAASTYTAEWRLPSQAVMWWEGGSYQHLTRSWGTTATLKHLQGSVVGLTRTWRWPWLFGDRDGICVARVNDFSLVFSNAQLYLEGLRMGDKTPEQMAAYVATAMTGMTVLYNNFMSEIAMVTLLTTAIEVVFL